MRFIAPLSHPSSSVNDINRWDNALATMVTTKQLANKLKAHRLSIVKARFPTREDFEECMETGTMVEVVDQAVARSYIGDERILVQMRGWKKRDKGYNSMICGKSEEWLARNDKIVSLQCRRRNTRNQTLKRLRDELYGKKQKSSGGGGASSSDGGGGGGGGGDCDSDDPDSDDDDDDEGSDGTDDEDSDGDAYNDDHPNPNPRCCVTSGTCSEI